jgi:hypothetical protein
MPTRRLPVPVPPAWALALGLALTATLSGIGNCRAQDGKPLIPDIERRSGLLHRFVLIDPHLPPDTRRDQWYDTRWGDPPNLRQHPNYYTNGGLYGLRWKAASTQSFAPYFYGAPGSSTLTEDDRPVRAFYRPLSAIVHPFKPVGMYYEQGSYVPVYDLDPVVPGPGPMIWPWFRRLTNWGG